MYQADVRNNTESEETFRKKSLPDACKSIPRFSAAQYGSNARSSFMQRKSIIIIL